MHKLIGFYTFSYDLFHIVQDTFHRMQWLLRFAWLDFGLCLFLLPNFFGVFFRFAGPVYLSQTSSHGSHTTIVCILLCSYCSIILGLFYFVFMFLSLFHFLLHLLSSSCFPFPRLQSPLFYRCSLLFVFSFPAPSVTPLNARGYLGEPFCFQLAIATASLVSSSVSSSFLCFLVRFSRWVSLDPSWWLTFWLNLLHGFDLDFSFGCCSISFFPLFCYLFPRLFFLVLQAIWPQLIVSMNSLPYDDSGLIAPSG
jgi:hypothetical protein